MQVLKLPAIAGLIWVSAGFRLLFQQALRMFSLIVMYLFATVFAGSVATILESALQDQGVTAGMATRIVAFCFGAFGPILMIGYMEGCRDVVRGERISPLYFLRGFRLPRRSFLTLLALGVFQVTALTLLLAVIPPSDFKLSDLNVAASTQASPEVDPNGAFREFVVLIVMMLVQLTVWYAPMLAAWHNMRIGKSMFFSLAACWRNKGAFFMFGIGWMIAGSFCLLLMGLLLTVLGKNDVAYALLSIIFMMMVGAGYCSIYVTYSTVFVSGEPLDA